MEIGWTVKQPDIQTTDTVMTRMIMIRKSAELFIR